MEVLVLTEMRGRSAVRMHAAAKCGRSNMDIKGILKDPSLVAGIGLMTFIWLRLAISLTTV